MLILYPRVFGCRLFADAPPSSWDKVIWLLLRWFYRVVLTRSPFRSYHIIPSFHSLGLADRSLYNFFYCIFLFYIEYTRVCYRLVWVSPIRFDLLRRWPLVALVLDAWPFGLPRLALELVPVIIITRLGLFVSLNCWLERLGLAIYIRL